MKNSNKIYLDSVNEYWFKKNISKTENNFYLLFKRTTDIILGLIGFIIFVFSYPIFALLIKIDSPGPVLYCHQRVGKNGKLFCLCKFRNMTAAPDQYSRVWREKDKNNITRVGWFLRKTHLDELPQSWNILKGEISFIGPRAEWVELAKVFEKEIPFYKYRYLVKPGLFGWAQINFPASKSVKEAKEKFEYDLYYIKNHSILLDMEILLKSIKVFFI
jgi:lipopolysaccharide/colanic/teichoic acid biosynthesis glycosyltransferase